MKKYIRSATKKLGGQSFNYTSLQELKNMLSNILDNYNISPADGSELLREQIQFVAGPAEIVVTADSRYGYSCKFTVYFNDTIIVEGRLNSLFNKGTKTSLKYQAACQAAPDRLESAISSNAIDKKYKAALAKENKKASDEDIYNVIRPWGMSREIAMDAIRKFRYQVKDEDWARLSYWRMSLVDSSSEEWASMPMQAYGRHYTDKVELDTGINTYTTDVHRSEGWYTE
jgi:hypothetical protein